MQNNFEPSQMKKARAILFKDLQTAVQAHIRQKEQAKERRRTLSLFEKIKRFFKL